MRKTGFLVTAITPFLFSCAQMLSVGHENFMCEATEGAGVCGTMEYVYKNRHKLLNKDQIVVSEGGGYAVIEGEGDKVVLIGTVERKKICEERKDIDPYEPDSEEEKTCRYISTITVKRYGDEINTYEERPVPVREEALVQRIWIYPYVDKSGNFVEGHFIYTIIKEGRWLDPRGREVD